MTDTNRTEPHLWEVLHSYYCTEGNYFRAPAPASSTETVFEFSSGESYFAEMGDADKDYNLLFRWDWQETDAETEECNYTGDDHFRNGTLSLFFMRQRKGFHSTCLARVCRADESAVRAYLEDHWAHLQSLWAPISSPRCISS